MLVMDVSHLRIVLLGKNLSENSRVGNFLLGRAVFDSEAPPDVVERVGGRLKDRYVMVINSPQLLQTNISDHQITQTVRECVNLSDPGPHVFILVLQHNDFTEEDMRRVKQVLKEFSDEAIKRTIVLTTDEEMHGAKGAPEKANELFQQLAECGGGHVQLDEQNKWLSEIFRRVENRTCEMYENTDGTSVHEQQSGSESSVKIEEEEKDSDVDDGCVSATSKQKLNLVLCGSDGILKLSVSKLIRGKKENLFHLHHKKKYKDCVRRDVELHGCLISLVELPALYRLSEEEVMCQTLRCVSLCDPGVHAFLLILPDAPLNNEDKAEIEKVQKIFSSRIENHLIILRVQGKNMASPSSATETSIQTFRYPNFVLENSSQVPALLQELENMIKMNNGTCYTTIMYLQAQIELERNKHRAEVEELRRSMMKNQSTAGATCIDVGVRFVLLGKTGVGKSATANTILGREAFTSELTSCSVTRECQKEISEFNRRQITVIDTPGLFDTGVDNVDTRKEIVKCISMAAPGPHVFLLVLQMGRFTQEEKDTVKMIQETFGDKSRMYTIVLFTRGDELRRKTIQDFIEGDVSLKNLVHQCGKRYHVFNNNETKDRKQVSKLLEKIDRMVAINGGSFYTNEMFQQVEKNIKEEQKRIMREKEEEIKRKEEELKTKYEAEIEHMKKENERERQEMQNELRKSEEEFKMKEEEIKKETDENVRTEMQRKLEEQQKLFEVKINRKEKASGEHIQHLKIYLEEKHKKDKQNLLERIQWETREQAECEYHEKLEREVAKALQNAEEEHKAEKDRILRPMIAAAILPQHKRGQNHQAQMRTPLPSRRVPNENGASR